MNCWLPKYLKGMDLEQFTHLSLRNFTSTQTFYCPSEIVYFDKKKNNKKSPHPLYLQQQLNYSKMVCPTCLQSTKMPQKTASYSTFVDCLVATSRRQNFYLVLNFDRRVLQQTGRGHFSPIGGINYKRQLALVLDVARYKYPPFWCPFSLLFDAQKSSDEETQKPRGFCLISKDLTQFNNFHSERETKVINIHMEKKVEGLQKFIENIVEQDNQEMRARIVEFLFEITDKFEYEFKIISGKNNINLSKQKLVGDKFLKELVNEIRQTTLYKICKKIISNNDNNYQKNKFINLLANYQRCLMPEMLTIIILALPWSQFHEILEKNEKLREEFQEAKYCEIKKLNLNILKSVAQDCQKFFGFEKTD